MYSTDLEQVLMFLTLLYTLNKHCKQGYHKRTLPSQLAMMKFQPNI